MHKKIHIVFYLAFIYNIAIAQIFPGEHIDVIVHGDTLYNPWLGGLDLPQFSGADINRDGKEDLLIFDKKGNKVLVLLKQDNGKFKYAPDLEHVFPPMRDFALFRDYNCDGLVDIFTQTSGGIMVYRQEIVNGEITFELAKSLIEYEYNGYPLNLYNVNGDIPGIEDVDGDGDMDIIAFPLNLFDQRLVLFRNLSQELGYGCDSLIFEEYNSCWGNVKDSDITSIVEFDVSCKGGPSNTPNLSGGPKHIGSTILLFDPNEDGKMDVLIGEVIYNNLVYLQNKNTNIDAVMDSTKVDYNYPSYDVPIDVEIFPAAYYVDVTNDGKKDLIVAPNSNDDPSVNTTSTWLYENTGDTSKPFRFVKNNFLIDETIDLGSFSYPTFFDHNGDGLLDLIVANGHIFETLGSTISTMYYFENVGSDTLPIFELKDEDYLNLRSFNSSFLRPTFGDLDNDGDLDMIIGDRQGNLHYFENIAGAGNEAVFDTAQIKYFNIDVGDFAHPQLVDVNKDGLLDLVVGRSANRGEIAYYWNFGTETNPMFSVDSVNHTFGNIKTNEPGMTYGYSSPFILQTDSQDILYTGSDLGFVSKYIINPDSLKSGTFFMEAPGILKSKVGIRSNISIVDINNDGALDYFLGNSRGGVSYYSEKPFTDTTIIDTTNVGIKDVQNNLSFNLYPNPSNGLVQIDINQSIESVNIQVFNVLGQVVLNQNERTSSFQLNLENQTKGIYYVKIANTKGEIFVKSLLKE